MTNTDVAIITQQPPQRLNRNTGKPLKVVGKVSDLINRMIEEGETYQEAAAAVGMHVRKARQALDKPHVLQELKRRKQVFRAHISSANIHRLAQIRDQSSNQMAALGAIKVLEQIDDDPQAVAARSRAPGVVIVIGAGGSLTAQQREIEAKPLIEQDVGSDASEAND